jgi:hypothetical protein
LVVECGQQLIDELTRLNELRARHHAWLFSCMFVTLAFDGLPSALDSEPMTERAKNAQIRSGFNFQTENSAARLPDSSSKP